MPCSVRDILIGPRARFGPLSRSPKIRLGVLNPYTKDVTIRILTARGSIATTHPGAGKVVHVVGPLPVAQAARSVVA